MRARLRHLFLSVFVKSLGRQEQASEKLNSFFMYVCALILVSAAIVFCFFDVETIKEHTDIICDVFVLAVVFSLLLFVLLSILVEREGLRGKSLLVSAWERVDMDEQKNSSVRRRQELNALIASTLSDDPPPRKL